MAAYGLASRFQCSPLTFLALPLSDIRRHLAETKRLDDAIEKHRKSTEPLNGRTS